MIAPLPVKTRLIGGEGLRTYRGRHARNNLTTVQDVEQYVEEQMGERLSRSPRDPDVLQKWRELGALHLRSFTEPQTVAGNWVVDRELCERCCPHWETAHGRLPWIGWVCLRHKRWIGDDDQIDLTRYGEALVAERHWRGRLAPRGVMVECPAHLLALESATVGISEELLKERVKRIGSHSPVLLTYPETVRLTTLLTRDSFLNAVLGDITPKVKKTLVEREVTAILPPAEDAETWRAQTRVWDFVLDLQDYVESAQRIGRPPEDRWNVLQYSGFAQTQNAEDLRVDQVM